MIALTPFTPFSHIYFMIEKSLAKSLRELTALNEDIEKITDWVFNTDSLNRLKSSDYIRALYDSKFDILSISNPNL